jgi:protocatechuate 3,4-dioxygenase beta subunit
LTRPRSQLTKQDPSFIRAREAESFIDTRDGPKTLNTSHLSSITYTPHDRFSTIFAGNKSCILVPEAIEGPYYVSGELIRSDVREAQRGVDLVLDIQVIDVTTCKPVPNVMIDLWHANSTGVYSGVVSPGNGNISVESNINTTFHRGLQATNNEGVVQFTTLYPGHYIGRTQHIHVATHMNGT